MIAAGSYIAAEYPGYSGDAACRACRVVRHARVLEYTGCVHDYVHGGVVVPGVQGSPQVPNTNNKAGGVLIPRPTCSLLVPFTCLAWFVPSPACVTQPFYALPRTAALAVPGLSEAHATMRRPVPQSSPNARLRMGPTCSTA